MRLKGLTVAADEPDELYPEHRKLLLRMELPRAAYATLVARRLFFEANTSRIDPV